MTALKTNLRLDDGYVLGLVPARGGSKSIPLKNIAPLGGLPLIAYVLRASRHCASLTRTVCSTDHPEIAAVCTEHGVDVIERPEELGQDDTPVTAVILDVLATIAEQTGTAPGMVALLQPTSPFVKPAHVDACVDALRKRPDADSAQTVTPVFHNAHAFNQRVIEDGAVRFKFQEERRQAYNKQRKPKLFVFGNIVVSRSASLLAGKDCFGDVSVPVEIERTYALDVDTPDDLDYANYLIQNGKVALPS